MSQVNFGGRDLSLDQLEELKKALSIASSGYGAAASGGFSAGTALGVEDLDRTLKVVSASRKEIKLWNDIDKKSTDQVVSEYNIRNSEGANVSPFYTMGGLPQQTDSSYNREYARVQYLGVYGKVLLDLTQISGAHGSVVANEVNAKTLELLKKLERVIVEGDSSINASEFDGIDRQIEVKEALAAYKSTEFVGYQTSNDGSVVMNKLGAVFDDEIAEDAALVNLNNHGFGTDMYMPTNIHSYFSKDYFAKQRIKPGDGVSSGNYVRKHEGSLDFNYKPSIFTIPKGSVLAVAVGAGAVPTVANLLTPVHADSEFLSTDAGTFSYRISGVFADGETLAQAEINGAVAAGDKVTIDISYAGSPLYFNVYRALKDATTGHLFIGRIAVGTSGVAHDVDFNKTFQGSARARLLMNGSENDGLCWKQLGPMMKYDLARIDTSERWLQLIHGTPIVFKPRQMVILENLSMSSTAVSP